MFMQSYDRVLDKACPVTLGRIKAAKLKLGDDEDQKRYSGDNARGADADP
jgi:hypothetical protein